MKAKQSNEKIKKEEITYKWIKLSWVV